MSFYDQNTSNNIYGNPPANAAPRQGGYPNQQNQNRQAAGGYGQGRGYGQPQQPKKERGAAANALLRVPVDSMIFIEGEVAYSRLSSFIDGQELEEYFAKREYKSTNPIVHITLKNPRLFKGVPAVPGAAEWLNAASYLTKDTGERRLCIESKGATNIAKRRLPDTFVSVGTNPNGMPNIQPYDLVPGTEFAAGLPVLLLLRVYNTHKSKYNSISIESVISLENPVRLYTGQSRAASFLEKAGFTLAAANSQPIQQVYQEQPDNYGYDDQGMYGNAGYDGYGQQPAGNAAPYAPQPRYQNSQTPAAPQQQYGNQPAPAAPQPQYGEPAPFDSQPEFFDDDQEDDFEDPSLYTPQNDPTRGMY